jgi:UDP-N-acetylglucosamine 2-epimerase (hydrolysing)
LTQLGELEKSIFVIGSPDVDVMMRKDLPTIVKVKKHYQIPFNKFGVLIFHPVSTEIETLGNQIKEIIAAILKSNGNYIVIYPNNDNGSDIILDEYQKLKKNKNFKIFPSIRFENFLTILRYSQFILGNSSAGIREAEIYGVPSINIGTRQNNRTKNPNIVNVPSKRNEILNAIKEIKNKKISPSYDFGDGRSTQRFIKIIENDQIWKTEIQKIFIDLN